ncbi:DUF2510 domain-containing protein [bacterium]|nr:MAG: DUF2510 domain-containing protein [bacterium]
MICGALLCALVFVVLVVALVVGLTRRNTRPAPATASPPSPASWQADPSGRHQLRYWDGTQWTDTVSDEGLASVDPL